MSASVAASAAAQAAARELIEEQEQENTDEKALLASEFAKASFSPDEWSDRKFKNTTHQLMSDKERELRKKKKLVSQALKHAVSDNYTTFISTSREIGNLEIDMTRVRSLLADMHAALKDLGAFSLSFNRRRQLLSDPTLGDDLDYRHRQLLRAAVADAAADLDWLVALPERLTCFVVDHAFDAAVADAERAVVLLRKHAAIDAQLVATGLRPAVDASIDGLRDALERTLRSAAADPADVRQAIALMQRLGWAELAREAFLAQRSRAINAAVSRLAFGGDRRQYVGDVARLVFASIVSTCDDFVSSFTERAMLSAFVVWAVSEIERFAAVFCEYVFVPGATFELIGDAIGTAKQHCQILEQKGVYSSFLLDRQFHRPLRATIEAAFVALERTVEQATRTDSWVSRPYFVLDAAPDAATVDAASAAAALQLTESARQLFVAVQRFLLGTTRVVTLDLTPTLAIGCERLLANYLGELSRLVHSGRLSAAQSVAALSNAANVVVDLVPRVVETYQHALGDVPLRPMEEMAEAAEQLFDSLCDAYCERRSSDVVTKKLVWHDQLYTFDEPLPETAQPAVKFARFVAYLDELDSTLRATAGERAMHGVLQSLILSVGRALADPAGRFWLANTHFGRGGINQYLLDMRFFVQSCGSYAPLIESDLAEAMDAAIALADSGAVMPNDWLQKRVDAALEAANEAARSMPILPIRLSALAPQDAKSSASSAAATAAAAAATSAAASTSAGASAATSGAGGKERASGKGKVAAAKGGGGGGDKKKRRSRATRTRTVEGKTKGTMSPLLTSRAGMRSSTKMLSEMK
jgi:hypothetical protein